MIEPEPEPAVRRSGSGAEGRAGAFHRLMGPASQERLAKVSAACWRDAVRGWEGGRRAVLLEEAQVVLARAICAWAGVPLPERAARERARDLAATVDAFGGVGPRRGRGQGARPRSERWIEELVRAVRSGVLAASGDRALGITARLRGADGGLLPPRTAAVELLDVLRPTVAISWLIAAAAQDLGERPEARARVPSAWQGEAIAPGAPALLDAWGANRCAGEWITRLELRLALHVLTRCCAWRLAPRQDAALELGRTPAGPRSGVVLEEVRATAALDEPMPIRWRPATTPIP